MSETVFHNDLRTNPTEVELENFSRTQSQNNGSQSQKSLYQTNKIPTQNKGSFFNKIKKVSLPLQMLINIYALSTVSFLLYSQQNQQINNSACFTCSPEFQNDTKQQIEQNQKQIDSLQNEKQIVKENLNAQDKIINGIQQNVNIEIQTLKSEMISKVDISTLKDSLINEVKSQFNTEIQSLKDQMMYKTNITNLKDTLMNDFQSNLNNGIQSLKNEMMPKTDISTLKDTFMNEVQSKLNTGMQSLKNELISKTDISTLKDMLRNEFQSNLNNGMQSLKNEMMSKTDISALKDTFMNEFQSKLNTEFSQLRNDLVSKTDLSTLQTNISDFQNKIQSMLNQQNAQPLQISNLFDSMLSAEKKLKKVEDDLEETKECVKDTCKKPPYKQEPQPLHYTANLDKKLQPYEIRRIDMSQLIPINASYDLIANVSFHYFKMTKGKWNRDDLKITRVLYRLDFDYNTPENVRNFIKSRGFMKEDIDKAYVEFGIDQEISRKSVTYQEMSNNQYSEEFQLEKGGYIVDFEMDCDRTKKDYFGKEVMNQCGQYELNGKVTFSEMQKK